MGVYNIAKNIETWNINSTYDVGVIVEYNGSTYQALKKVPTGVNIGYSEYWKEITVEDDVTDLKGDVADLKGDVADLKEDVGSLEHDVEELQEDVSALTDITYDDEETVVGTWFNDAPIYQKRLRFTVATPSTNTLYDVVDLTDYTIDAFVKIDGVYNIVRTGSANDFDIWEPDGAQVTLIYNIDGNKKLQIRQNAGGDSSVTGYVTLWYTKEESEG